MYVVHHDIQTYGVFLYSIYLFFETFSFFKSLEKRKQKHWHIYMHHAISIIWDAIISYLPTDVTILSIIVFFVAGTNIYI